MHHDQCLDGNAAAGVLAAIFAQDATAAVLTCGGCGHEGPVAELRLYGNAPGKVLRCRACSTVNLRVREHSGRVMLDLSGAAMLVFDLSGRQAAPAQGA